MSGTPFLQLYVADYLADTLDLTTEQHGAYLLILMAMWRHDARLPDDPVKLARVARLTPARFQSVWAEISRYFEAADGFITNPRLSRERAKTREKSKKRAAAGSKGGQAKALKDKEARLAKATRLPQHLPETRVQKEEEPKGSLSADADDPPVPPPIDDTAEAVAAYNRAALDAGWPKVQVLSKSRRSALKARLSECGGIAGWQAALAKARASPLCNGQNNRGWTVNFDFLVRQSSFVKLMEGNYDDRSTAQGGRRLSNADASSLALAVAGATARAPEPDWF